MKIAIILGTRPEIIKLAPIIKELHNQDIEYLVIHSGQHFSYEMDSIFFEQLELKPPKYQLHCGEQLKNQKKEIPDASTMHGMLTGLMLTEFEKILSKEKPERIIIQGDTNTGLAAALAAIKLHIPIVHIEAGLRSYDSTMPEEINRIIIDRLSSYLFCPTLLQKKILEGEGVTKNVFISGNTIVDSLEFAKKHLTKILEKEKLSPKEYILVTLHREENVDNEKRITEVVEALHTLSKVHTIVFSVHPRTTMMMKKLNLKISDKIKILPPCGYFDFVTLETHAALILTDSGGLQEEACILGIPCVTMRENTERPETIDAQANILASTKKEKIILGVSKMLGQSHKWHQVFGVPGVSRSIVERVTKP